MATDRQRRISINGGEPLEPGFSSFEDGLREPTPDGDYWYDRVSGAWGRSGGPAQGFLAPELDIAGELPVDASGGGTGVIINGRELHPTDVMGLNWILAAAGARCLPGRWVVDAGGNLSAEGGMVIANLVQLAMVASRSMRGGGNAWSTRFGSGNESGGGGFVQTSDGTIVGY